MKNFKFLPSFMLLFVLSLGQANECVQISNDFEIISSNPEPKNADFPVNLTAVGSGVNAAYYFQWKDDANQIIDEGVGLTQISATSKGTYTLLVAESVADINNAQCFEQKRLLLGKRILETKADMEVCLGDIVELEVYGNEGEIEWSIHDSAVTIASENSSPTPVYFEKEGVYTFDVAGDVLEGNAVENGKFNRFENIWNYDINKINQVFETTYSLAGGDGSFIKAAGQIRVDSKIKAWAESMVHCEEYPDFNFTINPVSGAKQPRGSFLYADSKSGSPVNKTQYALANYVWQQSNLEVEPNTDYSFKLEMAEWNFSNVGEFMILVNGVPLKNVKINGVGYGNTESFKTPNGKSCEWFQIDAAWNSGNATIVTLTIAEVSGILVGGEFAIDNISLSIGSAIQYDEVNVTVNNCFELETRGDTTLCVGDQLPLYNKKSNGFQIAWDDVSTNALSLTTNENALIPLKSGEIKSVMKFPIKNYMFNGDFEGEELDFESDLTKLTSFSLNRGQYVVNTSGSSSYPSYFSKEIKDHTTGNTDGKFMALWFEKDDNILLDSIFVQAGKEYIFLYWMNYANTSTFRSIDFEFDLLFDNTLKAHTTLPAKQGWTKFEYKWKSDFTGYTKIVLKAKSDLFEGYIALDDISLSELGNELRDTFHVDVNECFDLTIWDNGCDGDFAVKSVQTDAYVFGWSDQSTILDTSRFFEVAVESPQTYVLEYGLPLLESIQNGGFTNGIDGTFTSTTNVATSGQNWLSAGVYLTDTSSNKYQRLTGVNGDGKFLIVVPTQVINAVLYKSSEVVLKDAGIYGVNIDLAYLSDQILGGSHLGFDIYFNDSLLKTWKPNLSNDWQNFSMKWEQFGDATGSLRIVSKDNVKASNGTNVFTNGIALDNISLLEYVNFGKRNVLFEPCGPVAKDTIVSICATENNGTTMFDLMNLDDKITLTLDSSLVEWYNVKPLANSSPLTSTFVSIANQDVYYTKVVSTIGGGTSYSMVNFVVLDENDSKCTITSTKEVLGTLAKVFPNPFNNELNIQADNLEKVVIYNELGEVLLKSNQSKIDVSTLKSGMYVVEIYFDGTTVYQKVFK